MSFQNKYKRIFWAIVIIILPLYYQFLFSLTPVPGYLYIYDNSGNRTTRTYSATVMLKKADTTRTEAVVGNTFFILNKEYP